MAIGRADRRARFDDAALLLGEELKPGGMYRLLAENGDQLFGDDYFVDLFTRSRLGRPTVPARVVATVMLLQAFDGLSDQEACHRLAFDLRWVAPMYTRAMANNFANPRSVSPRSTSAGPILTPSTINVSALTSLIELRHPDRAPSPRRRGRTQPARQHHA